MSQKRRLARPNNLKPLKPKDRYLKYILNCSLTRNLSDGMAPLAGMNRKMNRARPTGGPLPDITQTYKEKNLSVQIPAQYTHHTLLATNRLRIRTKYTKESREAVLPDSASPVGRPTHLIIISVKEN